MSARVGVSGVPLNIGGDMLINSTDTSSSSNSNGNVALIVDTADYLAAVAGDDTLSTYYSMNMITGYTVGTWAIVPGPLLSNNFDITFQIGHITILPAPLTVKPDTQNTEYGIAPAYTATMGIFKYEDTPDSVFTGTLTYSPSICNLGVGTHTVTPSGLTLIDPPTPNYYLVYENGVVNVSPATLTATADNQSRGYGFPNPPLTISYSGFRCSDNSSVISPAITASTSATTSSAPGGYPITLSTGSIASNYNINLVSGTLTVGAIPSCSINAPSPLPLCGSTGNTITATAPAGYTYSWGVTGTGWSVTSNGSLSITYTAGAAQSTGVFTLTLFAPETNFVVSTCTLSVSTSCGAEYCSYIQSFWANLSATNCNGVTSQALLPTLLTPDLVSGDGNRKILNNPGDAACLQAKLLSGNTASSLPNGVVHCIDATGNGYLSNGKFRSYLLGQQISLALSVRISPALGSLHITNNYISTWAATACTNGTAIAGTKLTYAIPPNVVTYLGANNTVNDLIILANKGLGNTLNGNNTPTLTEIANACTAIIQAFDHCRILAGFASTSQGARVENDNIINNMSQEIIAYPNPSTGNATVNFIAHAGGKATLNVYDVNGALISQAFNGDVTEGEIYSVDIDCSSCARGVYFMQLTVADETSFGKLIIINK